MINLIIYTYQAHWTISVVFKFGNFAREREEREGGREGGKTLLEAMIRCSEAIMGNMWCVKSRGLKKDKRKIATDKKPRNLIIIRNPMRTNTSTCKCIKKLCSIVSKKIRLLAVVH